MKKIIVTVVLIAAIAILFSKAGVHKTASDCVFYNMDGQELKIGNYKGKNVILLFWTTWCPYCRESLPVANSMYPDMMESGIELFGVNIQESQDLVTQYINAHPVDFQILSDKDGSCARSYGVVGIPSYILINKQGKVVAKQNSLPKNYKDLLSE
jgi:peroxiredoxin